MPHHFTKNTVEATFWCNTCFRNTSHRIDDGRRGPCLVCLKKLGDVQQTKKPDPPKQTELF
jgi:hypothetical protein